MAKPSETLLQQIINASKHPKSRKAIENIKAACDYLDDQKIEISVAEVGKLTKDRPGGPTAPSIRNKQPYLDYIRARHAEQKLPALKDTAKPSSVKTGNADADAYIYALEAQLRIAKDQLANLRSAIGKAGEFDLEATLKEQKLILASMPANRGEWPTNGANLELAEILLKIMDVKHLASLGLMLKNDRVYSPERNDKVFLEKREVECLRKEIDRQRDLNRKS